MEKFSQAGTHRDIEKSRINYEQAAQTIKIIAEEVLSLELPEKTLIDWKKLFSIIRIIDDRFDHINDQDKRADFVEKIKKSMTEVNVDFGEDEELSQKINELRELISQLDDGNRAMFERVASMIFKVTEKIKNEKYINKAVEETMLEGQITSKLFLPFLPREFKESEKYSQLIKMLGRLGRVANSIDTGVDLPFDYENKQVVVEPSFMNRLKFIAGVISSSRELVQNTPLSLNLIRELFKGAVATVEASSDTSFRKKNI